MVQPQCDPSHGIFAALLPGTRNLPIIVRVSLPDIQNKQCAAFKQQPFLAPYACIFVAHLGCVVRLGEQVHTRLDVPCSQAWRCESFRGVLP